MAKRKAPELVEAKAAVAEAKEALVEAKEELAEVRAEVKGLPVPPPAPKPPPTPTACATCFVTYPLGAPICLYCHCNTSPVV